MPDASVPGASHSNAAVPTAIRFKMRRRFYEAVVFLCALTTTYVNRRTVAQDLGSTSNDPFEAQFRSFVNTLSAFCDIKQGGDHVTAFTVLDLQDRIQYRFACNRVNANGLQRVETFVTDLLTTLRENASRDGLEQVLFDKVLDHCRKRVCSYLRYFNDACLKCISTKPTDARLLEQLTRFQDAATDTEIKGEDTRSFARGCRRLLDLIEECHHQPEGSVLTERPSHSGMNHTSSCWSELRHYAGRLNSYAVGVRKLMATATAFPRLVEQGFEVKSVPSSCPDPKPIQAQDTTALVIVRRMCPNATEALPYTEMLEETRSVDINRNIEEIVSKDTFRPIVHAELLILQSLEQDGLVHPSNFFGSWNLKYIGSSKPTCRLCHYYFQYHSGRFQVRSTHGNLYQNWKPPDVLGRDGEDAIKARENMMNKIIQPIREDGLRTLRERVPLGREHDSSTGMTFPPASSPLADHFGSQPDIDTSFAESDVTVDQENVQVGPSVINSFDPPNCAKRRKLQTHAFTSLMLPDQPTTT